MKSLAQRHSGTEVTEGIKNEEIHAEARRTRRTRREKGIDLFTISGTIIAWLIRTPEQPKLHA